MKNIEPYVIKMIPEKIKNRLVIFEYGEPKSDDERLVCKDIQETQILHIVGDNWSYLLGYKNLTVDEYGRLCTYLEGNGYHINSNDAGHTSERALKK